MKRSAKLVPIESGWMACETEVMCVGGAPGEGERVRFPVTCWLIEHERGLVLFDTGLNAELMTNPSRIGLAADIFDIEQAHTLTEQIERQGYSADDIDFIVFSHLHFDHSGATVEIPNARIIVQRNEWQSAHADLNVERGIYFPGDFDMGHGITLIDGEHDLFGDGALICRPTPGHTAGHQCLQVLLESGPVLLVGDCCYFSSMLSDLRLPRFSFDKAMQLASMKSLIDLQDAGVKLLFGHDREQWLSIDHQAMT